MSPDDRHDGRYFVADYQALSPLLCAAHRRIGGLIVSASTLLVLFGLAVPSHSNAATAITNCGQTVKGPAVLMNDLNCSGGIGIDVDESALIFLNGFTISGADTGVDCWRCKIRGPGAISDNAGFGIFASRKLILTNVEVRGNGSAAAAFGILSNAKIRNSTICENAGDGLDSPSRAVVKNSTIVDNGGSGISVDFGTSLAIGAGGRAVVSRSTVSRNGLHGLRSLRARVSWSTFQDNVVGGVVVLDAARVSTSTISGSGRFGLTDANWELQDTCLFGVEPPGGRLDVSSSALVMNNGTDAECGDTEWCADIASCVTQPRVKDPASCGTSRVNGSGFPGDSWGVCSQD